MQGEDAGTFRSERIVELKWKHKGIDEAAVKIMVRIFVSIPETLRSIKLLDLRSTIFAVSTCR
jgi:hypothetical protein